MTCKSCQNGHHDGHDALGDCPYPVTACRTQSSHFAKSKPIQRLLGAAA